MTQSERNKSRTGIGSITSSRRQLLQAMGTVGVAGLAGCTGGDGASPSPDDNGESPTATTVQGTVSGDQDPIVIGSILPLTGPLGEPTQDIRDMMRFLTEEVINQDRPDLAPLTLAEGSGLSNHNGRTVELVFADNRLEPETGRAEAERMIQEENVKMMIGQLASSVTIVAQQLMEREQVPTVSILSSSADLHQQGYNWWWRPSPHELTFVTNMFDLIGDVNEAFDPEIETAGLVFQDTESGSSFAEIIREQAGVNNVELIEEISYDPEELSSFTSQTSVLKDADPDVLFLYAFLQDGLLIAETFRDRDYFPPLALARGDITTQRFVEREEVSEYYCATSSYSPQVNELIPEVGRYNSLLEDNLGFGFDTLMVRGFSGFMTAMSGLNAAGSTDATAIQSAMNDLELSREQIGTIYGVQFADNGQNELATSLVNQIQSGQRELVWPFDVAEEDALVYPAPSWADR